MQELERESNAAKDAYQILLTAYKTTNEYGSYKAYLVRRSLWPLSTC